MLLKNHFNYVLFTDANGCAKVEQPELLKSFEEIRATFIMDYADPRIGSSGKVTSELFSNTDLERALDAYKMYSSSLSYPKEYEYKLTEAIRRGQNPSQHGIKMTIANK